jgi:hypothetical protein
MILNPSSNNYGDYSYNTQNNIDKEKDKENEENLNTFKNDDDFKKIIENKNKNNIIIENTQKELKGKLINFF